MSKLNLENVWQIMKKYDFSKKNEIENEFLCALCKKILINAHISPCTCRFCLDCISNYLNKEKKACPGNTDECKMVLISLNENIFVDYAINNKISKLIVKCPQKSCEFKDELRNIENHIRICNYQSVSCPYLNIGCNSSNMYVGNVIDHLQLEIVNHTKLLIDCIDNLNNEIGRLKIIVDKLREENKMLKCEINEIKLDGERKQTEIDKLNKKLQEIESKFEIESKSNIEKEIDKLKLDGERKEKKLEKKCAEQTGKIDLLNAEIVKLRNVDKCMIEHVDKLKLDGERNKKSIGTLEKKCEQQNEEQIQKFNKKYKEIENKFVNAKLERENKELKLKDLIGNEIDEMRKKQTEMRTISNRIDQTMKNVENKLSEIEINQNKMNYGEFVWRIDKINDKIKDATNGINTDIYSHSFYTRKHGYKMCLSVNPDGHNDGQGTHLSVFYCLMKGEFDDILQWPFKNDVTISLVNQLTRLNHVSGTLKYINFLNNESYNKPIDERNVGLGFAKFIELQELSNLTHNNQIFIKCSVNISS